MINLFKRVYLKHDNNLIAEQDQKRLIITDRLMDFPMPADVVGRDGFDVLGMFNSLTAADRQHGGREAVWHYIRGTQQRVCIIGTRAVVAELMIQLWRSIFKTTTVADLYELYVFTINNENLVSYHNNNRHDFDANATNRHIVALTLPEFEEIYLKTGGSTMLGNLAYTELPVECLLMNYFFSNLRMVAKTTLGDVLLRKVRDIVARNVIAELENSKYDLVFGTNNFYLLEGVDPVVAVKDPLKIIANHPQLSWVLDEAFTADNYQDVYKRYTHQQLKSFFQVYTKLFRFTFDEETALDYLTPNEKGVDDMAGLLDYDVKDEMGNFFCTEYFSTKVNGLLISYIYQLYRTKRVAELRKYELK